MTYSKATAVVLALLLPLLALALCPAMAEAATVRQHDIEIQLTPQKHELSGRDILTVDGQREPELDLVLARNAQILGVSQDGRKLKYSFNLGLLRISLPAPAGDKPVRVTVDYKATFDKTPPDNPLTADDPGYGVVGSITDTDAFLLPDSGWYPRQPGSMPTYSLKVQAPKGMLAVSEGRLVGHETKNGRTLSAFEVGHPLDGLSLVAGPYTVRETKEGNTPVYTYFHQQSSNLAESYLEASRDYLRLYSELLGPYPFEKFAVVENFFPTGYGFASYTLLGSRVIRLPFIIKTSLGHEIVHSWFGNSVLVDYDQGNWAEGLTTYLADYLSRERESAEEAREYRLQILRNYSTLVPEEKDFPLREFKGRMSPETQAVGYGKAAMVFHMARRRIGDDAFFASMRRVVREHQFKRASWNDFARIMSEESHQDMRPFFDAWTARPGAPMIGLQDVVSSPIPDGRQEITGTIIQQAPTYDLDMPLRITGQGLDPRDANFTTHAVGAATRFRIFAEKRPEKLIGDPDSHVFRRLWPEEIPPMVNSVRGTENLVAILSSRLSPDEQNVVRMLPAALSRGSAPLLREEEATPQALEGKDLLFLGTPVSPQLRSLLKEAAPPSLALDKPGFGLDSEATGTDSALFAVFKNPQARERTIALFHPLSAQAAHSSLRKIQHYGKYSFLVFGNGEVRAKGVWPYLSPLIMKF